MKKTIHIGNGILEQIKKEYCYKTIITKENLLKFAREHDRKFENKIS